MRLFMIAAALSIAALTSTGCATTGGGCGCLSQGAMGGSNTDCGCESDCGCETGGDCDAGCGCQKKNKSNNMTGLYSDNLGPGPKIGGGMAMPLFSAGAACRGGSCRGKVGSRLRGQLGCRKGLGCGSACVEESGCGCEEEISDCGCEEADCGCGEVVEESSPGILSRLKAANESAVAQQEAAFAQRYEGERVAALGCGRPGCGARGCVGCRGRVGGGLHGRIGNPYGGTVPHTTPPQVGYGGAGMAPTYAYPYYTTRGPRDFLDPNPPTIGY